MKTPLPLAFPTDAPSPALRALTALLLAGNVFLAWCALAPIAGNVWWALDLFSHFPRQWYWCAVFVAGVATLSRQWGHVLAAAALAGWFAWWARLADAAPGAGYFDVAQLVTGMLALPALVNPWARPTERQILALGLVAAANLGGLAPHTPTATGEALVRYSNAYYWNSTPETVARELLKPAQMVAVVEEGPALRAILEGCNTKTVATLPPACGSGFADVLDGATGDPRSYGLYAREAFALKETLTVDFRVDGGTASFPIGHAVTRSGLHVYVAHPFPPMDGGAAFFQRGVFEWIATRLEAHEKAGEKFVVVGDFNSTPFSPTFRRTLGKWALRGAYSWSVGSPLSIPIDHVLTNIPGLTAAYGPTTSSDHVPVAAR